MAVGENMELDQFTNMIKFYASQMKFPPDFSNPMAIDLWFEEFNKYTLQDVKNAFKTAWRTQSEFPAVKTLKSILDGDTRTREAVSKDIAEKILYCLKRYGCDRASMEAHKDLCDIGLEVVRQEGGWGRISEKVFPSNEAFMKKEWAAVADSILVDRKTLSSGHVAISEKSNQRLWIEAELRKLPDAKDD